jgi:hypothetical protein
VVEAFHVRPVLLRSDSRALSCTKYNLAIECLGEDLVEVTLVTGHAGAIGQAIRTGDTFAAARGYAMKLGTEIEQTRPFSRVLGARHLPVGAVNEGVCTIPEQAAFRNLSGVQFLSRHGLDGISPKGNHRIKLDRAAVVS